MHRDTWHLSHTTIPELLLHPFLARLTCIICNQRPFIGRDYWEVLIIIKPDTKATVIWIKRCIRYLLCLREWRCTFRINSRNGMYTLVPWQLASDPDRIQASAIWCCNLYVTFDDFLVFLLLFHMYRCSMCTGALFCKDHMHLTPLPNGPPSFSLAYPPVNLVATTKLICNVHPVHPMIVIIVLFCIKEISCGCDALPSYQIQL